MGGRAVARGDREGERFGARLRPPQALDVAQEIVHGGFGGVELDLVGDELGVVQRLGEQVLEPSGGGVDLVEHLAHVRVELVILAQHVAKADHGI